MMCPVYKIDEESQEDRTVEALGRLIEKICKTNRPPTAKKLDQIVALTNSYSRLIERTRTPPDYDPNRDGDPWYAERMFGDNTGRLQSITEEEGEPDET